MANRAKRPSGGPADSEKLFSFRDGENGGVDENNKQYQSLEWSVKGGEWVIPSKDRSSCDRVALLTIGVLGSEKKTFGNALIEGSADIG